MRLIFKSICVPILKLCLRLFYDSRYLKGKWFDDGISGWRWALRGVITQKFFGINRHASWPVGPFSRVVNPENITFDPDDIHNFQTFGCYFQCLGGGKIVIGKGSYIAPNVGLVTANHDMENLKGHCSGEDIILGEQCWIGMNSVILPGVTLGSKTVVAAGAVVTKSFLEGNCVIAGVPAKIIKKSL